MSFVADVFESAVDVVSDAISDIGGAVGDIFQEAGEILSDIGQFVGNVIEGVAENAYAMAHGAITGNWVEFRDATMGMVTTAVAVAAIIVGGFMGVPAGPWILAAGFIMLDAQYNEGEILARVIHYAAELEKATTHTNYIESYAAEIQMLITTAAMVGASVYGGGYIYDVSGLSAAMAQWSTQISVIQAGYGGYQTYMALQAIRDSQAYWEAKLREYEAYLRSAIAAAQEAKEQWFGMMTNSDLINRIQAGGDLFLMGAGHELWSVSSVAEPKYALGLIDVSDKEMDRLMNNRYYTEYAGSDAFKIK